MPLLAALGANDLRQKEPRLFGTCGRRLAPQAARARFKMMLPAWHALDLRLMFGGNPADGVVATAHDIARLTRLLGHGPRSYAAFAPEAAAQWAQP